MKWDDVARDVMDIYEYEGNVVKDTNSPTLLGSTTANGQVDRVQ